MRIGWIRTTTLATSLVLVASTQTFAATTFNGTGSWYSGSSWSGGTVPTLADDVIIPTGYTIILNSSTGALANTLTLQGTSKIRIQNDSLEIDGGGGGNGSVTSINASDGVKLES